MNGKQFALGILFASLLIMTLVPLSSQQNGVYDPWADINLDGKVDISDLAYLAGKYGTQGSPERIITTDMIADNAITSIKLASTAIPRIYAYTIVPISTTSTTWVDLLSTSITVSRFSQLIVMFSCEAYDPTYIAYMQVLASGGVLLPGTMVLTYNTTFFSTYTAVFDTNVFSGSWTITAQWYTTGGTAYARTRSLTVIALPL